MLTITGQITEITPVPIASQYLSLFITFRDGRIIKFQCPPTKFLEFHKKCECVIHCSDDGLIKKVDIKPKKNPPQPKKKPTRKDR